MSSAVAAVQVTRAEEAESGFARIVEQFLSQSLDESAPKRQRAKRLSGRIAMTASDHGYSVTLLFAREGISILDGAQEPLDASIAGPYQTLVDLIQGDDNPLKAHLAHRIKVKSSARKPFFPLHVHNLMKLDKEKEEQAGLIADVRGVALAAAATVMALTALFYLT